MKIDAIKKCSKCKMTEFETTLRVLTVNKRFGKYYTCEDCNQKRNFTGIYRLAKHHKKDYLTFR